LTLTLESLVNLLNSLFKPSIEILPSVTFSLSVRYPLVESLDEVILSEQLLVEELEEELLE